MFIVRKITVADFGVYSIVLTVMGFLITFGFSWSSSAITYIGAREKVREGKINKTFWSRTYITIVSFLMITISFFIFREKIENYIGLKINSILLIWLVIKIGIDNLNTYFLAIKEQVTSALVLVFGKSLFLISVIILNYSLIDLIILSIVSDAIGLVYCIKINKKDIGRPRFDKENFKEVLNFGLWQLFGFSGLYLINFGDNFIIRYYLTLEDVAIYNAAYGLFNGIASLSFIISSYYAPIIIPILEKKEKKELKLFFYKERFFLIIMILIPHLILVFYSNEVILLIYGTYYSEAGKIFLVLIICSFIRYATVFNILIYNGLKKYKVGQLFNILRAILNVIFSIIFVKKYGVIGAAFGTLLAIIVTRIMGTIYSEGLLKEYFDQ